MTLILFVCRGNTCRSPMAEAIATDRARQAGLAGTVRFRSAGIAVPDIAASADPRAVACLAEGGHTHASITLARHRTQAVTVGLLQTADRIYALNRPIRDLLLTIAPADIRPRIGLLMHLVPTLATDDVADPYYGDIRDYRTACALIEGAVAALISSLAATGG